MVIKQVLKNGKCAKCGHPQEYMVVEEVYNKNEILKNSKERYSNFKNPYLNVCEKCGYVAFNLTESISPYSNFNKDDYVFPNGIINFDSIYQVYAQSSPLDYNCMRVFAKIYDLHEFSIQSIYAEHLGDENFNFEQISTLHKQLVKRLIEACEMYQAKNGLELFVECFHIELLSCIGETNYAKHLLKLISDELEEDLQDYLLDCIEMGEDDENLDDENGGEN